MNETYGSVDGLAVNADHPVLRVRLDRPHTRNAITDGMTLALIETLERAGRDEAIRVIVLSGAGDDFCAGADIVAKNPDGRSRPRVGSLQRRLPTYAHRLIPALITVQTPVVCRVQGWAAGLGLHLVAASDFAVAADDARLWEPFSARGFTPDSGGAWLLPRRVGEVRARELLLLGRELSGAQAAAWGLVHHAVPVPDLDDAVEELVGGLASGPTVALGLTKWLLHAGASAGLDDHLRNEAFALELSSRTDDFREGLAAFAERRDPRFRGR